MGRSTMCSAGCVGAAALAAAGTMAAYLLVRARRRELAATGSALGQDLLLDEFLPQYHFRGLASTVIQATPEQIFRALEEVTLADMPLADALIRIRYLPGRLLGHRGPENAPRYRPLSEQVSLGYNIVLAQAPQRELVLGGVGQFHSMLDQKPVKLQSPEEFLDFSDPAHEKLAMSWYLAEGDPSKGYRLVMEVRTQALSEEARRLFVPYWWLLIRWGSDIMSRILLSAVRRRAEGEARLERLGSD